MNKAVRMFGLVLFALFAASPARAADTPESAFAAQFTRLCVRQAGTPEALAAAAGAEKWAVVDAAEFPRRSSVIGQHGAPMNVSTQTWRIGAGGYVVQSIRARAASGKTVDSSCALATYDLDLATLRAALLADPALTDGTPPELKGLMNLFTSANGPINVVHGQAKRGGEHKTVEIISLTLRPK